MNKLAGNRNTGQAEPCSVELGEAKRNWLSFYKVLMTVWRTLAEASKLSSDDMPIESGFVYSAHRGSVLEELEIYLRNSVQQVKVCFYIKYKILKIILLF